MPLRGIRWLIEETNMAKMDMSLTIILVTIVTLLTWNGVLAGPTSIKSHADWTTQDTKHFGFRHCRREPRSQRIAITCDDRYIVVPNKEAHSISVLEVRDEHGNDVQNLVREIRLDEGTTGQHGREPTHLALTPDDRFVLVSAKTGDFKNGQLIVISLGNMKPDSIRIVGQYLSTDKHPLVGSEPRGIAISPNGRFALVANHTSAHVSVISLNGLRTRRPEKSRLKIYTRVPTGGHPTAIAVSDDGDWFDFDEKVYVTRLFSEVRDGEADSIPTVEFTDPTGERVTAPRGDGFDNGKVGIVDAFGLGRAIFNRKRPWRIRVKQLKLEPLADSGFAADRTAFCAESRESAILDGQVFFPNRFADDDGELPRGIGLKSDIFCPITNGDDFTGDITRVPQGVYPNKLNAILLRRGKLFVPNIGAQPEPPVRFDANIQALVSVYDLKRRHSDFSLNLNAQIADEDASDAGTADTDPTLNPLAINAPDSPLRADLAAESYQRLFLGDITDIAANRRGSDFLILSRGTNSVLRAVYNKHAEPNTHHNPRAHIGNPLLLTQAGPGTNAVRYQTGNLPVGVVVSHDGKRAYTNNEIGFSVTAIDLDMDTGNGKDVLAGVIELDIPTATLPVPRLDNAEYLRLAGKLAYFTNLGVPDTLSDERGGAISLRTINPIDHRGKSSRDGWSGCDSCHSEGVTDNVTWIFATGPRQTMSMASTFAHLNPRNQKTLNWDGVRGNVHEFNNNARAIQGGVGQAHDGNPVIPAGETTASTERTFDVFNHGPKGGTAILNAGTDPDEQVSGPEKGMSDILDAMDKFVTTLREPNMDPPRLTAPETAQAESLFARHCAACHGGAKWSNSRTSPLFADNVLLNDTTDFAQGARLATVSGTGGVFPANPIGPNAFVVPEDSKIFDGIAKRVNPIDARLASDATKPLFVTIDNSVSLASPSEDGLAPNAVLRIKTGQRSLRPALEELPEFDPQDFFLLVNDVGTFQTPVVERGETDAFAQAIEIRGQGAIARQPLLGAGALGKNGYNSVSLMGLAYHRPWLHRGQAATIEQVFAVHTLPRLGEDDAPTIADLLGRQERRVLRKYILSIDEDTPIFDIGEPDNDLGRNELGYRQVLNTARVDLPGGADTRAFLWARTQGLQGEPLFEALFPVPVNASGPLAPAFQPPPPAEPTPPLPLPPEEAP